MEVQAPADREAPQIATRPEARLRVGAEAGGVFRRDDREGAFHLEVSKVAEDVCLERGGKALSPVLRIGVGIVEVDLSGRDVPHVVKIGNPVLAAACPGGRHQRALVARGEAEIARREAPFDVLAPPAGVESQELLDARPAEQAEFDATTRRDVGAGLGQSPFEYDSPLMKPRGESLERKEPRNSVAGVSSRRPGLRGRVRFSKEKVLVHGVQGAGEWCGRQSVRRRRAFRIPALISMTIRGVGFRSPPLVGSSGAPSAQRRS